MRGPGLLLLAIAMALSMTACSSGGSPASCARCGGPDGNGGDGGTSGDGSGGADAGSDGCVDGCSDAGVPNPPGHTGDGAARVVAYVNCLCGFGAGARGGECLASPDPTINQVKQWEDGNTSPITHYVLSFLSFSGGNIQTDPGEIWANGGGSSSDFTLQANLADAMRSAQAHGKRILLSVGGEVGSSNFLAWWNAAGATTPARVAGMRAQLQHVAQLFAQQNALVADGFDVDIELGGVYQYGSDKYNATRDLINAVPDDMLVAFVPQIGNGLCAAPVVGDPLAPPAVLGGQCQQPVNGDDSAWVLARLDKDCVKGDGTPKLDYWGIQYYNAGQAECCGGGTSDADAVDSIAQSYKNLANGWPASGDTTAADNPWHQWAYYPGPWPAFAGIGADRLVLGKPGCQGCAGSDYLDLPAMLGLVAGLDKKLAKPMGGVLFWDLCRLFGNTGPQCVSGTCQPSWGGDAVLTNLQQLSARMSALATR
ncbi:MAG TPA: hypothetical protein VN947_04665 [Polyangia bacterium]|nr:hypothetical protein [Polyangia bacterium]